MSNITDFNAFISSQKHYAISCNGTKQGETFHDTTIKVLKTTFWAELCGLIWKREIIFEYIVFIFFLSNNVKSQSFEYQ
jgi:hypothetical protein